MLRIQKTGQPERFYSGRSGVFVLVTPARMAAHSALGERGKWRRKPINAKSETIAKLPSCRDGRVEPMYEIDGSFCYRH
jgi:hypothetical protein